MANRTRGIAATGESGRRDPGSGGLRSGELRDCGHLDPAAQLGEPDRPDVARRIPQLGAGPAAAIRSSYEARTPAGRPRSSTSAASAPTVLCLRPSTTATPNRRYPEQRRGPQPNDAAFCQRLRYSVASCVGAGPHGLTTVAIDLSDVQHTVRSLVYLQFGIG